MNAIEVTARQTRRRAGINFPKGQKIPVSLEGKSDDEIKELIAKLESDPVLKIHIPTQDNAQEGGKKTTGKTQPPKPPKKAQPKTEPAANK